jgi:uncharacterized membrane protein YphA (DoxX/SURF4 family)
MLHSERYAYFALRISLAIVFLWFGIAMFVKPLGWFGGSFYSASSFSQLLGITHQQLIYLVGVFEVLTGLSLLTRVFIQIFSLLAAILLILAIINQGQGAMAVAMVGLVGALVSIVLHVERPYR